MTASPAIRDGEPAPPGPTPAPDPQVLRGQAPAARADPGHGRPAARCRRNASWPSTTERRGPRCARPWPSSWSKAGCCACRARGPSWPSRRSRSCSSWPATRRGCGRTGCTRRPGSWTPATCPPTRSSSELLAIPAGSRVLRIHRLRLADGEPMSTDTSHLPARRFPGLRRNLDRYASLYEALASAYGVQLTEAVETIETGAGRPQGRPAARRGRRHAPAAAVPAGVRRLGGCRSSGPSPGTGATATSW